MRTRLPALSPLGEDSSTIMSVMTHSAGPFARYRRLPATASVAAGLAMLAGCSSGSAPTTSAPPASEAPASDAPAAALAAPYQSPDGYRISPPAGWVQREVTGVPGLSVAFIAPEPDTAGQKPFADNLNMIVNPTADSLDNLVEKAKQESPTALPNYQVVVDEPTTAGGQPAHLLGATYDQEGTGQARNIQVITVSGGKEYTATVTATAGNFDRIADVARASLASLSLG